MPPVRSQHLVSTYLNEVALLEQLRRETKHVVLIHDFDFDPQVGRGIILNIFIRINFFTVHLFKVILLWN